METLWRLKKQLMADRLRIELNDGKISIFASHYTPTYKLSLSKTFSEEETLRFDSVLKIFRPLTDAVVCYYKSNKQ
jgi:pantothenate kinase-related protein Tda10